MEKVYKLKENLYTKDNNLIPSGTLFYIFETDGDEVCYASVFCQETKIVWANPELFEFCEESDIPDDPLLKKISFLLQS